MSTPAKIVLGIVALILVLAVTAPSEAAAEAAGLALGQILLFCGVGYLVLRRAR